MFARFSVVLFGCAAEPIAPSTPVDTPSTPIDAGALVDAPPTSYADTLQVFGKCVARADNKAALTKCVELLPENERRPPVSSFEAGVVDGATQVNGWLPVQLIQAIVRTRFGRFRLCYEDGLRRNPKLDGRVAIKFVIDLDGNVSVAQDEGSDLPDKDVIACVATGFQKLQFPPTEGGIVTVVYPIIFHPGD